MNFLAHALLAGDDPALVVGGVIGDWIKGPLPGGLPADLARGVALHRAIDSFAEKHPAFRRSRTRVSAARRRYAGVLVDIFYDHLLASEWAALHPVPFAAYRAAVYRQVAGRLAELPEHSRSALELMAAEDWFHSYANPGGIADVLARMSRRARRPNPLAGGEAEFLADAEGFRADFHAWLPDAQAFARSWIAPAQSSAARLAAALAMHQQGMLDQAEVLYEEILKSEPAHFDALQLLGTLASQRRNSVAAIELFDRALRIMPDCAEVLCNRGSALRDLKLPEEALESFDRALEIKPDHADAHYNRGNALRDLGRHEGALEGYDCALGIRPDYVNALYNRGNVLRDLQRHEEALASYDRLLEIMPGHANALNNRGAALCDLGRPAEALESYDRALRINPAYAEALKNRGNALHDLKRPDEAMESYRRALEIRPDYASLYGTWLHTKMQICDWDGAEAQCARVAAKILSNQNALTPFPILAISGSRPLQRRAAEIWVQAMRAVGRALPAIESRPEHDRIRLGYFSADFHGHATAHLMAELFERHDRSRFELTAFSFGPDKDDGMRKRIAAAFDRFVNVRKQSDRDVAMLARNMELDIAIDLKGFTQDNRAGIFSLRAAPVQVAYLGYPGTTGAAYMDYLIADPVLIPESHRKDYAESIAYLPNSYQVNDGRRAIADRDFTREEMGLPQRGFIFCCFNSSYKILPETFDGWMRILGQVEGSVLWLLEDNPGAANNLRREAGRRGVDPSRLIFAGRMPQAEHLARHRLADLFLDTLPCNAHTTASDALWAGLPVLTRPGETFAGRVAASLLNAIHLPELVTFTPEAYEALAIELATNPEKLGSIKRKLAANRLDSPLFDCQGFARDIEELYATMYARHRAGLAPGHLFVKS